MDFGKLASLAGIDLQLPKDTSLTEAFLAGELVETEGIDAHSQAKKVYIGSTAWGQKSFVGPVYPTGTKSTGYLTAYAKQFNTIELNTSFYRIPAVDQVIRWAEQTPEDFRFCPKVSSMISQASSLGEGTGRIAEFTNAVAYFGVRLGPCFIQLPATFKTSSFDSLLGFLDRWPTHIKLAIELRHSSWFCESAGEDLFAELVSRGIGTVITDVAGRRDVAHMNVTSKFQLVRWVGNVADSDEGRLQDWASRTSTWLDQQLDEVYFFVHQPEELPSATSSISFGKMLSERMQTPFEMRVPRLLSSADTNFNQIKLF